MVSVKLQGGLGNNLFQIAFVYSFAKKYGLDYCVPKEVLNPHANGQLYTFPEINYCDSSLQLPTYNEKHYHYEEIQKIDNVIFVGFWQSYKYFNDYKDEIIKLFGFDDIKTKEDVCAIHLRFGDYLNYPLHHPVITSDYISLAILYMADKGCNRFDECNDFYVFSDDINLAKSILKSEDIFGYFNFKYSEGRSELEDLREMASCSNIITSNSSFSWWAAYINPNPDKKIIMPSVWFGPELKNDVRDLYLPQAHII